MGGDQKKNDDDDDDGNESKHTHKKNGFYLIWVRQIKSLLLIGVIVRKQQRYAKPICDI